ncbi:hypothetical protein CEXT_382821 [Caerostris extrusa]|uniref:Secreted protein n=1 Tax=Caerostris extrusa TaxID=172846 RepID=A0AAV4M5N3_CAEEX|nr:hypothetical protein CEXT_382821 [Caerostris extrusa]
MFTIILLLYISTSASRMALSKPLLTTGEPFRSKAFKKLTTNASPDACFIRSFLSKFPFKIQDAASRAEHVYEDSAKEKNGNPRLREWNGV